VAEAARVRSRNAHIELAEGWKAWSYWLSGQTLTMSPKAAGTPPSRRRARGLAQAIWHFRTPYGIFLAAPSFVALGGQGAPLPRSIHWRATRLGRLIRPADIPEPWRAVLVNLTWSKNTGGRTGPVRRASWWRFDTGRCERTEWMI